MKKTAAGYLRVSSWKQSETSLETQEEAIKAFAKANNMLLVKIYKDKITASGAKSRPGFQALLEDARGGLFDFIIVYKYDRFERDSVEDQLIIRELESKGVLILSTKEVLDPATPAGRFQRWIISGMNRFYIENLRQEIQEKTTRVAKRAYFLGGIPPYGFSVKEVRDPEASRNRKIYAINEEEAAIVKEIFKRFANGEGYGSIVRWLNESGHKTRSGKTWSRNSIVDMLKNERYTGTYVFRKGYKHNYHAERDDTIRVSGAIPRIIDDETWRKVQAVIRSRKRRTPRTNSKSILSGLVYCGDCGAKMVYSGGKAKRFFCSRYLQHRDVYGLSITARKLEPFVIGYLQNLLDKSDKDFEAMARGYNEEAALRDTQIRSMVENLEAERVEVRAKIQRAIEAVLNDSPLKEELEKQAKSLTKRLTEIDNEIQRLKSEGMTYVTAEMIKRKYEKLRTQLRGNYMAQRQLIINIIEKITVYPGGYIEIKDRSAHT